ncbi:MAG: Hsp20/alpha crystallin family protein [Desulfobacterales bacterium]|nr:Hsp20/alpha crystallin family protein [Desulfobacterales bacterium]
MDYIKIRFSSDLAHTGVGFEKTVDEMFQSMSHIFSLSEASWKPSMDIYETQEEIIILALVAGVAKGDIELEVDTKAVKISGRRAPVINEEDSRFCLAEIQYGAFERTLFLPAPINTESVSAAFVNGFLQIRMSKLQIGEVRKIQIESAE